MTSGAAPSLREMILAGAGRSRISFLGPGGEVDPVAVGALVDRGTKRFGPDAPSPATAAILTNDRCSVEIVLGAIARGARLVSLPLPPRGSSLDDYVARLGAQLAAGGIGEVVAADEVADLLDLVGVPNLRHSRLDDRPLSVPAGAFELVQFSSGSTAAPKGILVADRELGANLAAILDRTQPTAGDVAVSWLPLSHDMGLIGMLLSSIAAGAEAFTGQAHLGLLDPRTFLRDPRSWTRALVDLGATFTASPDFGLRLAARRGLDGGASLERLRCLIVGGEIVRPTTLRAFGDATGCPATALCPAYGLAEVGLAVSIDPPGRPWRSLTVDPDHLAEGRRRDRPDGAPGLGLARCGEPLAGYRVWTGGGLGPVEVSGPSIGRDAATGAPLGVPHLDTGDVGFLDGDDVVVIGRSDDVIVVHGRRVHAPHVEDQLGGLPGLRAGRTAAVVLPSGEFVVAWEAEGPPPPGLVGRVTRLVVGACGAAPDHVVALDRGSLPMTASGKLRRREVAALCRRLV